MRLGTSGNLGIGISSPTQMLHIQKSGTDNYIKVDSGDTGTNYSGIMLSEYNINYGWTLRQNAFTDFLHISYQDNTPSFTDLITFDRVNNRMDVNGTFAMKNGIFTSTRAVVYSMGNLQAQWLNTAPSQLAIALVSGTNSGGYAAWVSTYNGTGVTGAPSSTTFVTVATASAGNAGDVIIVNVSLLSSSTFYRVTAQIGGSYTSNPIIIEKLI
jgi:hypothetical protein